MNRVFVSVSEFSINGIDEPDSILIRPEIHN